MSSLICLSSCISIRLISKFLPHLEHYLIYVLAFLDRSCLSESLRSCLSSVSPLHMRWCPFICFARNNLWHWKHYDCFKFCWFIFYLSSTCLTWICLWREPCFPFQMQSNWGQVTSLCVRNNLECPFKWFFKHPLLEVEKLHPLILQKKFFVSLRMVHWNKWICY